MSVLDGSGGKKLQSSIKGERYIEVFIFERSEEAEIYNL